MLGHDRLRGQLAQFHFIEDYEQHVANLLANLARRLFSPTGLCGHKNPETLQVLRHHKLSIPAEDQAFDLAYALSVFTHLLQTEIFIYMVDIARH